MNETQVSFMYFIQIMRIIPECLSCIVDDGVDALHLLGVNKGTADEIIADVLVMLGKEYPAQNPPSYYITDVHRIIKRRLCLEIPFADLREICLTACATIAAKVAAESAAYSGTDKLRFLICWSIAANMLDFRTAGAGYGIAFDRIDTMLRSCFNNGLVVDDCERIADYCAGARSIVYIPDNVGELPFDKLLIAELKRNGANVIVPFRGGAITSDVIMADADAVALHDVADRIILSGPDTLGVSFSEMTDEFYDVLCHADVIIAKGQANFYVLDEFGNRFPHAAIISLLVTKCRHISNYFGQEGKVSVASIIKESDTVSL